MPTYKIKTLEKKNIWETQYWTDDSGRSFEKVEMFRWGEAVITTEEPLDIETISKNEDGFYITDHVIEDINFDDGCALYFEECFGIEEDWIEEIWDQDGTMGFEDSGFEVEDIETVFHGPLEIEEIVDE